MLNEVKDTQALSNRKALPHSGSKGAGVTHAESAKADDKVLKASQRQQQQQQQNASAGSHSTMSPARQHTSNSSTHTFSHPRLPGLRRAVMPAGLQTLLDDKGLTRVPLQQGPNAIPAALAFSLAHFPQLDTPIPTAAQLDKGGRQVRKKVSKLLMDEAGRMSHGELIAIMQAFTDNGFPFVSPHVHAERMGMTGQTVDRSFLDAAARLFGVHILLMKVSNSHASALSCVSGMPDHSMYHEACLMCRQQAQISHFALSTAFI